MKRWCGLWFFLIPHWLLAFDQVGYQFWKESDYKRALIFYEKSSRIDLSCQGVCYFNEAVMLLELKYWDQAFDMFLKSITYLDSNPYLRAQIMKCLCLCLEEGRVFSDNSLDFLLSQIRDDLPSYEIELLRKRIAFLNKKEVIVSSFSQELDYWKKLLTALSFISSKDSNFYRELFLLAQERISVLEFSSEMSLKADKKSLHNLSSSSYVDPKICFMFKNTFWDLDLDNELSLQTYLLKIDLLKVVNDQKDVCEEMLLSDDYRKWDQRVILSAWPHIKKSLLLKQDLPDDLLLYDRHLGIALYRMSNTSFQDGILDLLKSNETFYEPFWKDVCHLRSLQSDVSEEIRIFLKHKTPQGDLSRFFLEELLVLLDETSFLQYQKNSLNSGDSWEKVVSMIDILSECHLYFSKESSLHSLLGQLKELKTLTQNLRKEFRDVLCHAYAYLLIEASLADRIEYRNLMKDLIVIQGLSCDVVDMYQSDDERGDVFGYCQAASHGIEQFSCLIDSKLSEENIGKSILTKISFLIGGGVYQLQESLDFQKTPFVLKDTLQEQQLFAWQCFDDAYRLLEENQKPNRDGVIFSLLKQDQVFEKWIENHLEKVISKDALGW